MKTPDDLKDVEFALQSLSPAAGSVNRDHLMFEAGRAAARRAARPWQAMTGVLMAALVTVMALPRTVDRPDRVAGANPGAPGVPQSAGAELGHAEPLPQPPDMALDPEFGPLVYIQLRRRVLEEGLEALPAAPRGDPAPPLDPRHWREFLERTL
jgi:hypothetical protein